MAAVMAADIYSRAGFSLCLAYSARRVMVLGGSTFHPEPGTIGDPLDKRKEDLTKALVD